ncbi:kinase-like domain-containing protein, partial [Mycena rebaudengoi]
NILITSSGRASIADFGLSSILDVSQVFFATTSAFEAGSARWAAPELIHGLMFGERMSTIKISFASDIYAFGCVCYEIFSRELPFHEIHDGDIPTAVLKGVRPSRPDSLLDDRIWDLITEG